MMASVSSCQRGACIKAASSGQAADAVLLSLSRANNSTPLVLGLPWHRVGEAGAITVV